MPCPTCDHTLQKLEAEWFWCPRCGTVRRRLEPLLDGGAASDDTAPMLVKRCRLLEGSLEASHPSCFWQYWKSLQINESVRLPGDRKC